MTNKNQGETAANNEEKTTSAGYRFVSVLRSIFVYILAICIVGGALLFASNSSSDKSLFGYRWYTILTASMEPEYSVGDIIIVKLTDAEDIESGDVITFNPSNDSDAYLTHRVTEKLTDYNGTGVTCFRTKGDANNVEDSFLIDSSRVVGTVSFNIPKIGYAVRFVQLKWYIVLPLTVMILVLFQLLKIYFRDNGESGTETET
jgi:signal peptidase